MEFHGTVKYKQCNSSGLAQYGLGKLLAPRELGISSAQSSESTAHLYINDQRLRARHFPKVSSDGDMGHAQPCRIVSDDWVAGRCIASVFPRLFVHYASKLRCD